MFPCSFVTLSTLNFIARIGFDEASGIVSPHTTGLLWAGIVLVLMMVRIGNLSFCLSMLLTKEHSPNAASLGACNGLVQFAMCLARAVSPALLSSVFALSIDNNLLGGYFWVFVVVAIGLAGVYQTKTIARVSKEQKS
jgi:hypothetical protein